MNTKKRNPNTKQTYNIDDDVILKLPKLAARKRLSISMLVNDILTKATKNEKV